MAKTKDENINAEQEAAAKAAAEQEAAAKAAAEQEAAAKAAAEQEPAESPPMTLADYLAAT